MKATKSTQAGEETRFATEPRHPIPILRLPAVKAASGKGRTAIYSEISQKLFPRPVRLSARAVGWPENEVAALNQARIAGATDAEIRALVVRLEAARKLQG